MSLEELDAIFPEDPTQTSLALVASSAAQITIPYSNGGQEKPIVNLTSGCRPYKLEGNDALAPFDAKTALSERSLKDGVCFRNETGAQSRFHKAITSHSAASAEHTSFNASAGVGGKFLGASVSGKYNKNVSSNEDEMKASIQASIRTGTIYIDDPRFSLDALAATRKTRSIPSYFSEKYGDYYVASLQLGADAGVLASSASSAHAESESLDVKVTLHVLWWDVEVNYHSESQSSEFWSQFRVTGFDTLAGENVSGDSLDRPAQEVIGEYIQRVTNLEKRARGKMKEFGLTEGKRVDLEMCRRLCEAGLVVEITLLPYSRVRDYLVALNDR